jgi:hypothetical protein
LVPSFDGTRRNHHEGTKFTKKNVFGATRITSEGTEAAHHESIEVRTFSLLILRGLRAFVVEIFSHWV